MTDELTEEYFKLLKNKIKENKDVTLNLVNGYRNPPMSKSERFNYFILEGLTTMNLVLGGANIAQNDIFSKYIGISGLIIAIPLFGFLILYISHYNLKPVFWNLFPRKIRERYY